MTKWKCFILTLSFSFLFEHLCFGQTDSLYTAALKKADSAYEFKSWTDKYNSTDRQKFEEAKKLYRIALQIKPNETYPANRVKEIENDLYNIDIQIEKTLYDIKNKPTYNKLISKADSLFFADNYKVAQAVYIQAESLYSEEKIKDKLSAISALTSLSNSYTDTIIYIKHGISFGMCHKYCFHETRIENNRKISVSKFRAKEQLYISDTLQIDEKYWQNVVQAINLKTFYKLPHTLGCPDCTDGGAEWIEIGTKYNVWKVEFDYGSHITELENLLTIVRQTE